MKNISGIFTVKTRFYHQVSFGSLSPTAPKKREKIEPKISRRHSFFQALFLVTLYCNHMGLSLSLSQTTTKYFSKKRKTSFSFLKGIRRNVCVSSPPGRKQLHTAMLYIYMHARFSSRIPSQKQETRKKILFAADKYYQPSLTKIFKTFHFESGAIVMLSFFLKN